MVLIFVLFGYQKWCEYEAETLIPFISNGPLTSWMYPVFGLHGASYFLGVSEWLTAALLVWGFWNPRAGILGAAPLCRHVRHDGHHHPVHAGRLGRGRRLPGDEGQRGFLMKDFVLLAVSVYLLKQDVARGVDPRHGRGDAGDRRAVEAVP